MVLSRVTCAQWRTQWDRDLPLETCPALNCQSFFAKLRHLHLCSMCSKYFYYAAEEASSMVVSLRYVDILHPTGHYTVYVYENLCSGLGLFPWENPVHHCLRSVGPICWLASWPVATRRVKNFAQGACPSSLALKNRRRETADLSIFSHLQKSGVTKLFHPTVHAH